VLAPFFFPVPNMEGMMGNYSQGCTPPGIKLAVVMSADGSAGELRLEGADGDVFFESRIVVAKNDDNLKISGGVSRLGDQYGVSFDLSKG
jgi:hypothetical protein